MWVSAHTCVSGNKKVNELAKAAVEKRLVNLQVNLKSIIWKEAGKSGRSNAIKRPKEDICIKFRIK